MIKLLKSKLEFENWKLDNIFLGDEAEDPKEYPCFVNKEVLNWNCEQEFAVYFYKDTLQEMVNQLNT